jgi:hypothetical protein
MAIRVQAAILVRDREEEWAERIKWLPSIMKNAKPSPGAS